MIDERIDVGLDRLSDQIDPMGVERELPLQKDVLTAVGYIGSSGSSSKSLFYISARSQSLSLLVFGFSFIVTKCWIFDLYVMASRRQLRESSASTSRLVLRDFIISFLIAVLCIYQFVLFIASPLSLGNGGTRPLLGQLNSSSIYRPIHCWPVPHT